MYDMPDDEIIGFWGKRPFIGKAIPYSNDHADHEPLQLPAFASRTETASEPPPPQPASPSSWHADPQLFRHSQPVQAAVEVGEQVTP
jgi:hypothetical protein